MSEHYFSNPNEKLSRDLLGIREMALDSPQGFEYTTADLYAAIRTGLDSEDQYTTTIETLLDLIARAVADETSQPWFERVAEIVEQHPVSDGNLFETGFREAIREFQPFVGVYGKLSSTSAVVVDDLLQLYIKLFRVLFYKPIVALPHALLEQAFAVSKRLGDHIENSKLYQTVAIYYTHYGDFEIAERYAKLAFNDCETIDDATGIADAACTLAIVYRSSGRFASADYYIQRALKKAPPTVLDKRLATLFYEYGVVCFRQDKYELALSYYERALAIFEDYEAIYQITITQHALVLVYLHMGRFEQAEALLKVVQSAWQRLGNKYDWVNSHFAAGELEIKRGNRSLGVRMLENAIDLAYSVIEDIPARDILIGLIQAHIDRNLF